MKRILCDIEKGHDISISGSTDEFHWIQLHTLVCRLSGVLKVSKDLAKQSE